MPQKRLNKKIKKHNSQNRIGPKKNIRKAMPQREKTLIKNPHLNVLKKGYDNITKVINKNIESFALEKAKIGYNFLLFLFNF